MLPAIAGIEIKVEKLENVFKLSQNRDKESYLNIIGQLKKQGGDPLLIANEMAKRIDKLFPPGVEWDSTKFSS
jgi:transcriptional regulator